MPNLLIENKKLKEQLARLEAEKAQIQQEANPYENLPAELDGRQRPVTIVYGPNAQNLRSETLPLQQAFDRLVSFYSSFSKPTDRNVPREYRDANGMASICNQDAIYIKKVFRDALNKQKEITLLKEVPLWLAVDDVVQKEQKVTLITIKEFDDFTKEEIKKDIRSSAEYQEKKRRQLVEQTIKEELGA